jgi:radical SAM protein with 4Fe4S-binding SPASM domain
LLVPNVLDYFRYIRRASPQSHINLTTNGSRLIGGISEAILKEDLIDSIILSLEGADPETYESIRVGLGFEEVRNNFLEFLRLRKQLRKTHPTVSVAMVIVDRNRGTKAQFAEMWKEADAIRYSVFFNWAGKVSGKAPHSPSRINYCERMDNYISILADGRVALCCFDSEGEYIVGDVRTQSIREVWLSAEFMKLRRQLFDKRFDQLKLCGRCDFIRHPAWKAPLARVRPLLQRRLPAVANLMDSAYKKLMR